MYWVKWPPLFLSNSRLKLIESKITLCELFFEESLVRTELKLCCMLFYSRQPEEVLKESNYQFWTRERRQKDWHSTFDSGNRFLIEKCFYISFVARSSCKVFKRAEVYLRT